jgi:hypothetical protein
VPQDRELPVQVVRGQALAYRFAYTRSADTRASGDTGQDYLAVREGVRKFVFALCDGVSQSFYGDLAARYLGDALVAWIEEHLPPAMAPETIRKALTAHLQDLTGPATEEVRRHPLPPDIPQMLRDVLEEKRALGSESTFVCGRIDLPGADFPAGRIVLAWMGDSRLRLWMDDDARTASLGGVFETAQRWSSRRGLVGGALNVYVAPLQAAGQRVSRLMTYSDGLAALDTWKEDPSNHAVQNMIARAGEAATSDDIAFLEVWLGPVPAHIEAIPVPAPLLLEVGLREGRIRAAWRPVPGAQRYQVEVRDGKVQTWDVTGTDWESPEVPAGEYRLRVRAWRDEAPGEWSEERQVSVPSLVKPVERRLFGVPREWRVPLRAGCVTAALAFIALAVLAGLALPVSGPLHGLIGLIFGPARTPTPTVTVTPVETATPTNTPTPTWTSTPTEMPTGTESPTTMPAPQPTQMPTGIESPPPTPTISPARTPTEAVSPPPTSSPAAEEPTPTATPIP